MTSVLIIKRNGTKVKLNYKNEAKKAIKRIDKIIQKWEENWLESREAIELLAPDLKIVIRYFERLQDKEKES